MVELHYLSQNPKREAKLSIHGDTDELGKAMLTLAVQLETLRILTVPQLCAFMLAAAKFERKRIKKAVIIAPEGMPEQEA